MPISLIVLPTLPSPCSAVFFFFLASPFSTAGPLFDATWRRKNTFRRDIGIFSLSRQYHCNKCLRDDSINRTAKILLENVSLDGRVVSTKFFLHVCTCKPTSVRLHASNKDNILMKEVWPVISSAWSDNGNRLSRTFVYATRVVSANRQRPPNHRNRNYLEEARCTSIELCAHTGTWKNTREAWAALVAPWVFIQLFPVRIKNWKTCAVLYRVMESTKEVEKKTTHRVGTSVVS